MKMENVKIILCDLSDLNNCTKLYMEARDENIDILVNNAGFGIFGKFWETDINKELEEFFFDIIVPMEEQIEIKDGGKKTNLKRYEKKKLWIYIKFSIICSFWTWSINEYILCIKSICRNII